MHRDVQGWIREYQKVGGLWIHDGNPLRPHACLTSGKHSNGFFNSRPIIAIDELLREAAADLVELMTRDRGDLVGSIDGVIGPQTGATKLAEYISQVIWLRNAACLWTSPEKEGTGDAKSFVFSDGQKRFVRGRTWLPCDDVLTTSGSVEGVAAAVESEGGSTADVVLLLVNRSGLSVTSGGRRIIALVDREMPAWEPDDCPHCKAGSEAIRPKGAENWARLNAHYD